MVSVPSQEQAVALENLREKIAAVGKRRDARQATADPEFLAWIERQSSTGRNERNGLLATKRCTSRDGLIVHCRFESDFGQQVSNDADRDKPGRLVGGVDRVEGAMGAA